MHLNIVHSQSEEPSVAIYKAGFFFAASEKLSSDAFSD